jgi:hypothetical protein
MTVITFPSTLFVKSMRWERLDQDVTFSSVFGRQSATQMAPLWKAALTFNELDEASSGAYQSLLMKLEGSKHQLALWNVGRPVPLGTYTGASGTTVISGGTVAVGASSLTFTNATYASCTLVEGDMVGVNQGSTSTQQVVMVTADATANGSGVITVSVKPALRNTVTNGSTVILQQPKVLFRQQSNASGWDYERNTVSGFNLDLLEDPRA